MVRPSVLLRWLLTTFPIVFSMIFTSLALNPMNVAPRLDSVLTQFTLVLISFPRPRRSPMMIDKLLSIIPFKAIKQWLSDNPEVALLLLLFVFILSFVGGMYIA